MFHLVSALPAFIRRRRSTPEQSSARGQEPVHPLTARQIRNRVYSKRYQERHREEIRQRRAAQDHAALYAARPRGTCIDCGKEISPRSSAKRCHSCSNFVRYGNTDYRPLTSSEYQRNYRLRKKQRAASA
jgi:hypothetical protein